VGYRRGLSPWAIAVGHRSGPSPCAAAVGHRRHTLTCQDGAGKIRPLNANPDRAAFADAYEVLAYELLFSSARTEYTRWTVRYNNGMPF